MNKTIFILIMLFFSAIASFGADSIPQKVTLSLDPKNIFYSIDILLQKSVLGASAGNQNIVLLPAGRENLDVLGIKQINANLNIRTKRTGDSYTVEITSIDAVTNLIDNSIRFKANMLASSITATAKTIFDLILNKFPPKPVQELKTIEVVKVGVSEFETMNPAFRAQVLPIATFSEMTVELITSSFNTGRSSRPVLFSPQAELFFQYRAFIARADFGYSFGGIGGKSSSSYRSGIMFGYGIFQSLFVLGIDGLLNAGEFQSPDSINTNSGSTTSQNIAMPSISYFSLMFGLYFRFNLTKDYYFESSVGIPGFGFQSVDVNFEDPSLKIASGTRTPANSYDGPPFMKMRFTWRIVDHFHIVLHYSMFNVGFKSSTSDSSQPKPISLNDSLGISLRTATVKQYQIGLGMMYEF